MLFNSHTFLFYFLPLTLIIVTSVRLWFPRFFPYSLAIASLLFYGWFSFTLLVMLCISIAVNYVVAHFQHRNRWIFRAGILLNLLPLILFKYSDVLGEGAAFLSGQNWTVLNLAIPLGISFYTLQQIGYLFDVRDGKVKPQTNLVYYFTYVAFFPQLIAGPIVRAAGLFSQLGAVDAQKPNSIWENMAVGITWFSIGLFKKVVLADGIAPLVDSLYERAAVEGLSPFYAWSAAFSYGLQLYFDFSGYSTMAVGLGLMLGLSLPFNFDTPYQSTSPQEFWRRWHITLSEFLRDRLYIPLGGNRHGEFRMAVALMATMIIGGLWHGAGAQYAAWGAYHGILLILGYLVTAYWATKYPMKSDGLAKYFVTGLAGAVTLSAIMLGWLLFRAPTLEIGGEMINSALSVFNPLYWFELLTSQNQSGLTTAFQTCWPISALLLVAIAFPDVPKLLGTRRESFVTEPLRMAATCALVLVSLHYLNAYSPFLYFQF